MSLDVEVVVPTYARPDSLGRTLAGLARQKRPGFTVAVVDDCSPFPVARSLAGQAWPFELRLLQTPRNSGPAAARNLAVRTSEADLIVFVDDDVVPDSGLVDAHVEAQERGIATVTIGPLAAPPDWKPTPWNRWEAATLAVEYERMARREYAPTWRQFFTGNASVQRSEFLAVGGFDESFSRAEDIEFAYRLCRNGARLAFLPGALGWHYAHRSLKSWRRIPAQYAEFDLRIGQLHPGLNWERLLAQENSRRHPATRAVERLTAAISGEHVASSLSILGARLADVAGVHSASNRLLSLAFQLEYGKQRRKLCGRPPFNPPSTAVK